MVHPCLQIRDPVVHYNHRIGQRCSEDLLVQVEDNPLFAEPRSRDLKNYSAVIPCHELSPRIYRNKNGNWRDVNSSVHVEILDKYPFLSR